MKGLVKTPLSWILVAQDRSPTLDQEDFKNCKNSILIHGFTFIYFILDFHTWVLHLCLFHSYFKKSFVSYLINTLSSSCLFF